MKYTEEQLQKEIEKYEGQFMEPETYHGEVAVWEDREGGTAVIPADHYLPDELNNEEEESLEYKEGWIIRLSAPGYLDRTDWMGPFETEQEAWEELLEIFPPQQAV